MLWFLSLMWFSVVGALDLATVQSKLFTCTEFEILKRDNVDNVLTNVYQCMWDTHLFRITQATVDEHLRRPVEEYKAKLDAYEELQHIAATYEANSKRELRNIQRDIVAVRMNLKYLIGESHLPPLTHLSDETNLRNVDEYLKQNAQYVAFVKAIPIGTYRNRLGNITFYSDRLEHALVERDIKREAMQTAVAHFRNEIVSHYASYIVQ